MPHSRTLLDRHARQFYIEVLCLLNQSNMPYLVGGAYALTELSGIERHTRDLDLFVRKEDAKEVLKTFTRAGYKSEMTYSHWLGKAFKGENFIDVIFSSGNGIADVDDQWFERARESEVFGVPVKLCPPEEMIWSKGFIMERERFDGADVAHLIHACSDSLDWDHLLKRFGKHWRVLLAHVILFGFIYPGEKHKVPDQVMKDLWHRLENDSAQPQDNEMLCQGPVLSREQYLVDVECRGYTDARLQPRGKMSAAEIDHWTLAIDSK